MVAEVAETPLANDPAYQAHRILTDYRRPRQILSSSLLLNLRALPS
jgi:hypothetical protein